ncbi:MAG TPA: UDP-2,3-diacylglucosamine diphosphatase [Stenotrophobium sp.]|jgi:UDP-2,3-diacylglucosamine hydrolase|nr:UDP-2,3-diacylglucosamine diphosphatase [Stenotrophobium sp.]
MTKPVLLLADLHLPAQASPLRETFIRFLEGPAREAGAIYLLGDLFEYWIGDAEGLLDYAREISRLAALTARGVEVYFMHGNRDFMVGAALTEISGVQILPDPSVVELCGVPTLLSHGDLYCIDDLAYQRWRRFSRRPLAQWLYRQLPRTLRERIAGKLRGQSARKSMRPESIMDVNTGAIDRAFAAHQVPRLIHGHTHRPAEHDHGHGRQRIVLADWRPDRAQYLRVDQQGVRRIDLPMT